MQRFLWRGAKDPGFPPWLDSHLTANTTLPVNGTVEQPQCGFSNAVVQILWLHSVRNYAPYKVLDDPEL
ncbi:Glutaredoxin-related protein 5, mitochondrial [Plecturocebus cupreus]